MWLSRLEWCLYLLHPSFWEILGLALFKIWEMLVLASSKRFGRCLCYLNKKKRETCLDLLHSRFWEMFELASFKTWVIFELASSKTWEMFEIISYIERLVSLLMLRSHNSQQTTPQQVWPVRPADSRAVCIVTIYSVFRSQIQL